MINNEIENIKALIHSGDVANIEMALNNEYFKSILDVEGYLHERFDYIIDLLMDTVYEYFLKPKTFIEQIYYLKSVTVIFKNYCWMESELREKKDFLEIPESIDFLSNLNQITLDNNNIKTIPVTIGNLHNLTHLNLCGNSIEFIPESIYKLIKLKYVNLRRNCISKEEVEKIKFKFKTELPNCELIF